MRELRRRLAAPPGVLAPPRARRPRTLLAGGLREAWAPHGLALVLARRARLTVLRSTRTELAVPGARETRVERLLVVAGRGRPGREGRPGAAAAAAGPAAPRLELRLERRTSELRSVRRRVERHDLVRERTVRERSVRERLTATAAGVRREREVIAPGPVRARPEAAAAGRDGRDGLVLARAPRGRAPGATRPAASAAAAVAPAPAVPAGPPPAPPAGAPGAAPALDLLTEQVLRRIERRALAQRERLGLV